MLAVEPLGAGRAGRRPARARPSDRARRARGRARSRRLASASARPTRSGARLGAARHGEAIVRGGGAIHEALVGEGIGGDAGAASEGRSAREGLGAAVHAARELTRFDPRFEALATRLAGLDGELEDVASEVRALVEGLDHDPAGLARLEERLSLDLRPRAALRRRRGRRAGPWRGDGRRGRAAARSRGRARSPAGRGRRAPGRGRPDRGGPVGAPRRGGRQARRGGRRARSGSSGFGRAGFEVALGRRPADQGEPAVEIDGDALAFDATGIDEVVFRFAPNPGEPARPLARIASGGELSRVALAIKEVLAAADATPTLVFDEIDSGIGGRSADPVGRSLWSLARRHQVLCVTHLPQIAAHADVHFRIAKRERRRSDGHRGPPARRRGADRGARADARRARRWRGVRRPGRASSSIGRRPGARPWPGARRSPGRERRRERPWATPGRDRRLPAPPPGRARPRPGDARGLRVRPGRVRRGRRESRRAGRRPSSRPPATSPARPRRSARRASGVGPHRSAASTGSPTATSSSRPTWPPGSTCPRQVRRLPETLDVGETERLLEAASGALPDEPVRIRDRALLELLYAAGLRISEALGLDREDLSLDGGFVRVIGKGDRERLVPVGEVALDWLARYLDAVRPAWLALGRGEPGARRSAVPQRPRTPARAPAGLDDRPRRGRRRRGCRRG